MMFKKLYMKRIVRLLTYTDHANYEEQQIKEMKV